MPRLPFSSGIRAGRLANRGPSRCLCLVALLVSAFAIARAQTPENLRQQGYVNDFARVISAADSTRISEICRTLEQHTGDRMIVVTVQSTGNIPQSQFAEQLRKSWVADAVLRERTMVIVIAVQGRMGISTGSALDKILTGPKFNSAIQSAYAVSGSEYGPKLVYLLQEFAHDFDPAGSPSPPPPAPDANPAGPASGHSSRTPQSRQWIYFSLFALLALVLFLVDRFAAPRVRKLLFFILMFLCLGWVLYGMSSLVGATGSRIQFWFWMFIVVGVAGGLLGAEAQRRSGSRWMGMIFYLPTGIALAAICYVLARLAQARLNS